MNINVADGQLPDVRAISLADLESTGLDLALARLLSSNNECNFNSFNSSI